MVAGAGCSPAVKRLELAITRLTILPRPARMFVITKLRAFVHGLAWRRALPAPQWVAPSDPGEFARFECWLRTGERQWVADYNGLGI